MRAADGVGHEVAAGEVAGVEVSRSAAPGGSGVVGDKEDAVSQPERGADLSALDRRLQLYKRARAGGVQPELAAAPT